MADVLILYGQCRYSDAVVLPGMRSVYRNVICDTKTAMSSHAWQVFFIFMDKLDAVMPWFRPVCDLHMCLNYYFLQFKEWTVAQRD